MHDWLYLLHDSWLFCVAVLLPLLCSVVCITLQWYAFVILCCAHTSLFRFSLSMRIHDMCMCVCALIHLTYTGWLYSFCDEDTRKSEKKKYAATTTTTKKRQQRWRRLQRHDEEWNLNVVTFTSRTMIKPLHHYFWICCVATCNIYQRIKLFIRCVCVLLLLFAKAAWDKMVKIGINRGHTDDVSVSVYESLRWHCKALHQQWQASKRQSQQLESNSAIKTEDICDYSFSFFFFKFPFASNYAYKLWCS